MKTNMSHINLLIEKEIRKCLSLDKEIINEIDAAFKLFCTQKVIMPPVLSMNMHMINAEVDVKTAYVPGLDNFAIKISPGFFDNPKLGLPSLGGLMVTFSTTTGLITSILLDNGYLTDIRTAAAGGVAARYLAPQNVVTAGVVGCGVQAGLQVKALLLERDIKKLFVWGRDYKKAQNFAKKQREELGVEVEVANTIEQLVKISQVVITATPSTKILIKPEWLHKNLHITAVGSDSPEKIEIDPKVLTNVDLLVVDKIQQSIERGEMRVAINTGLINNHETVIELENICSGKIPARVDDTQITLCDLTGTGIQDTVIANYGLIKAKSFGLGTKIDND